jgi:hypothetical protein
MSARAYEINVEKYSDVLDYLNRQIDIAVHDKDKNKAEQKYHKFMRISTRWGPSSSRKSMEYDWQRTRGPRRHMMYWNLEGW